MKLLIIGSRSITDFDLSPYISADADTIIRGGAKGTRHTIKYAKKSNKPLTIVQI